MTKGAGEQSRGVSGIKRHTLTRVVGWLIVPFYVAGICTSYVLQHRVGLLGDNSVENAVLLVGFSNQKARCRRLDAWAARNRGPSCPYSSKRLEEEEVLGRSLGERLEKKIAWGIPQAKAWHTTFGYR